MKKSEIKERYVKYINSPEWKVKRQEALDHHGRFCSKCKTTKNQLHVHHLHYKNITNEKMEDLAILCCDCHNKLHAEINEEKERKIKMKIAQKERSRECNRILLEKKKLKAEMKKKKKKAKEDEKPFTKTMAEVVASINESIALRKKRKPAPKCFPIIEKYK